VWLNPPADVLAGVVPVELIIGRSDEAALLLTGIRAFPTGLAMTLHVRTRARVTRFNVHEEVFDGPYRHDQDDQWRRDRLKWGFEYADGRRATNVDPWPDLATPQETPDRPVLMGRGGGGDARTVDRDYWLWPLPPAGSLKVVCQWAALGIGSTTTALDADQIVAAASRAQSIWAAE
jgi:hypothetical protein